MLHVEETYKERGETLFEHTCTASCVFTCVSTCMCTTLHIIMICLLLNATRQKSNKADDKKKKNDGMTPVSSPLSQVCLSCQHPPTTPFISHSFNAATICYPLAYLAGCNTHTSRASSERQSEGHLLSTGPTSLCERPKNIRQHT